MQDSTEKRGGMGLMAAWGLPCVSEEQDAWEELHCAAPPLTFLLLPTLESRVDVDYISARDQGVLEKERWGFNYTSGSSSQKNNQYCDNEINNTVLLFCVFFFLSKLEKKSFNKIKINSPKF